MSNVVGMALRTAFYFFAMAVYVLAAVWAYYLGYCVGVLTRSL